MPAIPSITEEFEGGSLGVALSTGNTSFPHVVNTGGDGVVFTAGGSSGQSGTPAPAGAGEYNYGDFYTTDDADSTHTVMAVDWTARVKVLFHDTYGGTDAGYFTHIVNTAEVGRTPADWTSGANDGPRFKYDAGTKKVYFNGPEGNGTKIDISGHLDEWLDLIMTSTVADSATYAYEIRDSDGVVLDSGSQTGTGDLYLVQVRLSPYADGDEGFYYGFDDLYAGPTADDPFHVVTPYPDIIEQFEGASAGTAFSTSNTSFPRVDNSGSVFVTGGVTGLCAGDGAGTFLGASFFDSDYTDGSIEVTADDWTARCRVNFSDATSTPDTGYGVLEAAVGEVGRTPVNWTSGTTEFVEVKYDAGTKTLHLKSGATDLSVSISGHLGEWLDLVIVGTNGAATASVFDDTATLIDSQDFTLTADLYRARTQVSVYKDGASTFEWLVDDVYIGTTAGDPFVTGGGGGGDTVDVTLDSAGAGVSGLEDDLPDESPDFQIKVLDDVVRRAPNSITVTVEGARPEVEIRFYMDNDSAGQDLVYTTICDVAGNLEPTSLNITEDLGGQQGTRTLTAEQDAVDTGTLTASTTYFVELVPRAAETAQGSDTQAIDIPGAVVGDIRHWILQDLLAEEDGGIGSYILPANPANMGSPHLEKTLTTRHTTAKASGTWHVFEAAQMPKQWQWSGKTTGQEMAEQLMAYRALNRRFYVIDHRGRAWKVVFEQLDMPEALRTNYNGEDSDWIFDYTVSMTILDQTWVVPA